MWHRKVAAGFARLLSISGMTSVNGNVKQYIAISYILKPKHKGKINIAGATAVIAGKTCRSNGVTVNVVENNSGQNNNVMQSPFAGLDPFEEEQPAARFEDYILKKGESVQEKVNRNMQLKLHTDKTSVYEGEPILATYKLYSRLKSESNLTKNPSFNGFSVVDMQQNDGLNNYGREKLNGKEYNVYIIRKAQLYPLQSGTIELETATMDNRIQFVQYNGSNSTGAYTIDPNALVTENVSLSSKPLIVTVKPLPEQGKPLSFKGAVGNFKIEATLEKNNFSTQETGKLILSIAGKGNMQLLTCPDISWPAGFEAFELKVTDNTDKTTIPISGSKTFEIPFSVQNTGNYIFPSINFSFFDPATASYKILSTKEIPFSVVKSTAVAAAPAAVFHQKEESIFNKLFARRWLIILLIAGIIFVALILFLIRKEKKDSPVRLPADAAVLNHEKKFSNIINAAQQNPLSKTAQCLLQEECITFYSILNAELKDYLAKIFNYNSAAINTKTISTIMEKAGIGNDTSLLVVQLIKDIEWQLYTPFEKTEQVNSIYARAQTVIQMLNMERS